MLACLLSHCSHVRLFVTPRTVACQASLSMGFLGKNTGWVAMPSSQGKVPYPGIEPAACSAAPELQADSLPLSHQGSPNYNNN